MDVINQHQSDEMNQATDIFKYNDNHSISINDTSPDYDTLHFNLNTKSNETQEKDPMIDSSNIAAMELWDLIHAPKHRYEYSQRDRKLLHPSLPQPTYEEEQMHLQQCQDEDNLMEFENNFMGQRSSTEIYEVVDNPSSLSLEERLAKALEKAGLSPSQASKDDLENHNHEFDVGMNSSPTSTLQFPVDSRISNTKLNADLNPSRSDCEFVDSKELRRNPSSSYDFFLDHSSNVDVVDDTVFLHDESDKTLTFSEVKKTNPDEIKHETNLPSHGYKSEIVQHSEMHSFVICADTQIGMTSKNEEWETELNYVRKAVKEINQMDPLPAFVSVCGDLVDMEESFYTNKKDSPFSLELCTEIQDQQNRDFKQVWSKLDDRIPLVCLCGNHDIGNTPTKKSIRRFKSAFGDDYLSFWANGTYNIVLNNVLFNDPSGAKDLFDEQLKWMEEQLKYASIHKANQIFVFGHYPWFLYNEDEEDEEMKGVIPPPPEWTPKPTDLGFPDYYFHIRKDLRMLALNLFKKYNVSAAFSGHFHQNLISKTKWGMQMIITAPLSLVFESTGKPKQKECNGRGYRVVEVKGKQFTHRFEVFGEDR